MEAQNAAMLVPADQHWAMWRWWDYTLLYYSGHRSEEDLIELAGPFSNSRCLAHYAIGMKALSEGRRDKAKEHLTIVRDTRRVAWSPYHWANAFLKRMEEDPKWPSWIDRS